MLGFAARLRPPKTRRSSASEIVNVDARSLVRAGTSWRAILETLLYRPIKAFLEGLGFIVKGEIGGCDLLALKDDDPPVVVIGELKLTFNLELVLRGVDRAAACDEVWLAARLSSRAKGRASPCFEPTPRKRREVSQPLPKARFRLARSNGEIDLLVSPTSRMPRKNPGRRSRLVHEHRRRRGDPVEGGGSRKPIMTAYRQRALACAAALAQGPRRPRDLKVDIPDAPKILRGNVYGWFTPSSGESTLWPSLAEPPFCAGRSRRRRPQSIKDRSDPVLSSPAIALSEEQEPRHLPSNQGPLGSAPAG
jgi:hypothetical protein